MSIRSLRSALGAVAAIFAACSGLTPSLAAQTVAVGKVTFGADSVTAGTAVASTPKCYNSSLAVITCPSARTWFTTNPAVALVSTTGSVSALAQGRVKIGVCFTNRVCPARELLVGPLVVVPPPPTTTVPSAPGTPQFAIATAGSTTSSVRVTWPASTGATSYTLTGGVNGGASFPTQTLTTTSALVTAPNGAGIWNCVAATNTAGTSGSACNGFAVPGGTTTTPADTTPTTQPPADTTTVPGSHEPSGMTRIADRGFATMAEDGWGIPDSKLIPLVRFVQDATAVKSPSAIAQIVFVKGFAGGDEPVNLEKQFPFAASTLYVSYWHKFSANWQGHLTGMNKIMHFWIGGINRTYSYANGGGTTEPLTPGIGLQQVVNYNGSNQLLPNLVPTVRIVRGVWEHWEILFKGNTAGAANGTLDWWINGVHVGSYTGIQYLTGAGTWVSLKWAPTWGGLGDVTNAEQYDMMDHVYVSGKP